MPEQDTANNGQTQPVAPGTSRTTIMQARKRLENQLQELMLLEQDSAAVLVDAKRVILAETSEGLERLNELDIAVRRQRHLAINSRRLEIALQEQLATFEEGGIADPTSDSNRRQSGPGHHCSGGEEEERRALTALYDALGVYLDGAFGQDGRKSSCSTPMGMTHAVVFASMSYLISFARPT